MAGELQTAYAAGRTVYVQIRNRVGQIWSTSGGTGAFESYATANIADYAISLTQQGTASAYYTGTWPPAVPAGVYNVIAKERIGGSVAEADPNIAQGTEQWNGSALMPLSDLATSGQFSQVAPIRLARGTQIANFMFPLVSSLDHVTPFTSGVVSGQISRDGAAFTNLQSGSITEVGQGFYSLQALTSGDLLCNTAALVFSANGVSGGSADPRRFSFILQKVSGSF